MTIATEECTRKIYISGPMSGLPDFNYPAFFQAAEIIKSHGHEPINPAEGVTEFDRPWEWYMKRDLRLLLDADEVWMLPGWHRQARGWNIQSPTSSECQCVTRGKDGGKGE